MKTFLKTLLLLLALATGCADASENYLLGQAYFEDPSNSLTLQEVKSEQFTPYEGWLSKGYRPSTFWIRLDIRPSDKDLVLRIRPAYTESIELFDSSSVQGSRITGAKFKPSDADVQTFNHNFNLGAAKDERQIYLKVKSVRTYVLNFEVMPVAEFQNIENTNSLLFVAYIAFTLSLALWLLGAWLSNHEIVLGMFVIQQFISFLHAFFLPGYARVFFDRFIDPPAINYFTHLTVLTYAFIGILASKWLFKEYSLKRIYGYLFNAALCISILAMTLFATGNVTLALKINALLVIFIAFLFWATALFGTGAGRESKAINLPINILRIYYSFNLVMWAIVALPVLGFISSSELSIHLNYIYSALSGMLFCWILQYRSKSILKNETLKSAALKKEVENERFRREEQGKLMSMLTHEIRTPLSVLKLVVDRKVAGSDLEEYANRAVNNIDSIIDKCIQLDRLDLNALQIHQTKFNFLGLLNSTIADTQAANRFSILGHADVEIYSDADILSIIVSNLLGNALKYSAPETDIRIHVNMIERAEQQYLQLSVENVIGNMGVPDPVLAFEKYYRSPAAAKVSGSGLGLFLVRELAHALRGDVELSTKDHFITFTVWIPI